MNLQMGNQSFMNVEIPILWGKRAILEDKKGRVSIISLEGDEAVLEILGNKPAPNIQYEIIKDGFKIIINDEEVYCFYPESLIVTGLKLKLPECEINKSGIRIGSNWFSGNVIMGFGVGIAVDEQGISIGGPIPEGLAILVI